MILFLFPSAIVMAGLSARQKILHFAQHKKSGRCFSACFKLIQPLVIDYYIFFNVLFSCKYWQAPCSNLSIIYKVEKFSLEELFHP